MTLEKGLRLVKEGGFVCFSPLRLTVLFMFSSLSWLFKFLCIPWPFLGDGKTGVGFLFGVWRWMGRGDMAHWGDIFSFWF
jgi:hypothetical protein